MNAAHRAGDGRATALQRVVVEMLDHCTGLPEPVVAADRLFVVAGGTVPHEYVATASGQRAAHRHHDQLSR